MKIKSKHFENFHISKKGIAFILSTAIALTGGHFLAVNMAKKKAVNKEKQKFEIVLLNSDNDFNKLIDNTSRLISEENIPLDNAIYLLAQASGMSLENMGMIVFLLTNGKQPTVDEYIKSLGYSSVDEYNDAMAEEIFEKSKQRAIK